MSCSRRTHLLLLYLLKLELAHLQTLLRGHALVLGGDDLLGTEIADGRLGILRQEIPRQAVVDLGLLILQLLQRLQLFLRRLLLRLQKEETLPAKEKKSQQIVY